MEDTVTYF